MTELSMACDFVHDLLVSDATVKTAVDERIYIRRAASRAAFPCIRIQPYSSVDERWGDGKRAYSIVRLIVAACVQSPELTDSVDYDTIASNIDCVIDRTSGGNIVFCRRTEPYDYEYVVGGVYYIERGGFYTLAVTPYGKD